MLIFKRQMHHSLNNTCMILLIDIYNNLPLPTPLTSCGTWTSLGNQICQEELETILMGEPSAFLSLIGCYNTRRLRGGVTFLATAWKDLSLQKVGSLWIFDCRPIQHSYTKGDILLQYWSYYPMKRERNIGRPKCSGPTNTVQINFMMHLLSNRVFFIN